MASVIIDSFGEGATVNSLVEKLQSLLSDEADDVIFRVLLPDFNLAMPVML